MDFDRSPEQDLLVSSVRTLLRRKAGPERARALYHDGAFDDELLTAMADSELLDLARSEGAGPLEAALVVEEVAAALGTVHVGARLLVAPFVLPGQIPARIALVDASSPGPVRFGCHADVAIVVTDSGARVVELVPGSEQRVESIFGYPMGHIDPSRGTTYLAARRRSPDDGGRWPWRWR